MNLKNVPGHHINYPLQLHIEQACMSLFFTQIKYLPACSYFDWAIMSNQAQAWLCLCIAIK